VCEVSFDGHCSVWEEWLVKRARKVHACDSCGGTIAVGSSYVGHFSIYEGEVSPEKQCLPCNTIANAFDREHRARVTPASLFPFLVECLDEESYAVDDDLDPDDEDDQFRMRRPSRLTDSGLRWKYALVEMRARHGARVTP
jgi:hypothetical protein